MLLYINQKLFLRRWAACYKIYIFKGPLHNLHNAPSAQVGGDSKEETANEVPVPTRNNKAGNAFPDW